MHIKDRVTYPGKGRQVQGVEEGVTYACTARQVSRVEKEIPTLVQRDKLCESGWSYLPWHSATDSEDRDMRECRW